MKLYEVARPSGLGSRCGCNDCLLEASVPVRVQAPDGRMGTIWACADHAESLVQQLADGERVDRIE